MFRVLTLLLFSMHSVAPVLETSLLVGRGLLDRCLIASTFDLFDCLRVLFSIHLAIGSLLGVVEGFARLVATSASS